MEQGALWPGGVYNKAQNLLKTQSPPTQEELNNCYKILQQLNYGLAVVSLRRCKLCIKAM